MEQLQRKKPVLGTVKSLLEVTFYAVLGTYLAAIPVTYFTYSASYALPEVVVIALVLSTAFLFEAGKRSWRILK